MKMFLVMSLSVFALTAWGEDKAATMKRKAYENLDKRQEILTKARKCVDPATTEEALRACRKGMREDMKALKLQSRKEKAERKALEKNKDEKKK